MTFFARAVCDGCCAATVDIPMPSGRALERLIDALHDQHWTTPIAGVWLCPACAEVTELGGVKDTTEAMW